MMRSEQEKPKTEATVKTGKRNGVDNEAEKPSGKTENSQRQKIGTSDPENSPKAERQMPEGLTEEEIRQGQEFLATWLEYGGRLPPNIGSKSEGSILPVDHVER
jgi:hypothetical protein